MKDHDFLGTVDGPRSFHPPKWGRPVLTHRGCEVIPKSASVCVASVIHGVCGGLFCFFSLWFLCGLLELTLVVMTVGTQKRFSPDRR